MYQIYSLKMTLYGLKHVAVTYNDLVIQGDSVARGPQTIVYKNYVIGIMS